MRITSLCLKIHTQETLAEEGVTTSGFLDPEGFKLCLTDAITFLKTCLRITCLSILD